MNSAIRILALAGLLATTAFGDSTGRTAMLQSLERPGDFESRRSSSADPQWQDRNGDCRPIEPGETLTLAELEGPGRITHIWFTISAEDKHYPRTISLRMYWDGNEEPAVEAPIGDFFAVGHGLDAVVDSHPVAVSSEGRARNCYWPMPFRKSAKITVTNDSPDHRVGCFFWYIDWQKLPDLPEDTMYFHAQYRQEFPATPGEDYLLFDGEGDGVYVGTVQSVHSVEAGWIGEGDDRFFIDGATEPQLKGTGTEDYYCDAWGFRRFTRPFYGVSVWEGMDADARTTAYRWHIPDPVRFHKSLKVTIEHKGGRHEGGSATGKMYTVFDERLDHYSSVAFWYQRGQAKRFASLPPASERIIPSDYIDAAPLLDRAKTSGNVKPSLQSGGLWSGEGQIFWTNTDPAAWLEVPFTVDSSGRYGLKLDMTRSFDYGTFRILLDGKPVGPPRDLYAARPRVEALPLGAVNLTKGEHVLRFETAGANSSSQLRSGGPGYYLGFDGIILRKLGPLQSQQ